MKITVQYTAEDRLNKFFSWLKKRSQDQIHVNNKDLIADFVEKFLVVELKRLANNTDKVDEEIEVPDEVLLDPVQKALSKFKSRMDTAFNDIIVNDLRGNVTTETPQVTPTSQVTMTPFGEIEAPQVTSVTQDPGEFTTIPPSGTQTYVPRQRNGNGHKRTKKRDMTGEEKDQIRAEFLSVNGQIFPDACVGIHSRMADRANLGIFQVTGFVSYLHFQIAVGKIILSDPAAYETFIQQKKDL